MNSFVHSGKRTRLSLPETRPTSRWYYTPRLYDPGRVTVARESAREFVRENASVVVEYTELLTGGDVASVEEISAGQGAVLRRGLTKVAVYKDAEGRAHECSVICPHLGCVVHRNGLEKSWDCSCHVSRFTALVERLAGPANTSLVPA